MEDPGPTSPLKIGAFPRGVRFVSIYSKADRFSPFPCCILEDGGTENLVNIEVAGVAHREFVYKRSVYELVRRELAVGYGQMPPQQSLEMVPAISPAK